jgi:hypothetical protein
MSPRLRLWLNRILVAAATPALCYSLWRMIQPGMAGNTKEVWRWFITAMIIVIIGCIAFIAMLYTRSQAEGPERRSEMEILSAAVTQMERDKQAARSMQRTDVSELTSDSDRSENQRQQGAAGHNNQIPG